MPLKVAIISRKKKRVKRKRNEDKRRKIEWNLLDAKSRCAMEIDVSSVYAYMSFKCYLLSCRCDMMRFELKNRTLTHTHTPMWNRLPAKKWQFAFGKGVLFVKSLLSSNRASLFLANSIYRVNAISHRTKSVVWIYINISIKLPSLSFRYSHIIWNPVMVDFYCIPKSL